MVRILCQLAPASINDADSWGRSAVGWTLVHGDELNFHILVHEHGASLDVDCNLLVDCLQGLSPVSSLSLLLKVRLAQCHNLICFCVKTNRKCFNSGEVSDAMILAMQMNNANALQTLLTFRCACLFHSGTQSSVSPR